MRKRLASPLPRRHGLDAARIRLPDEGDWATVRDHLVDRLPRVNPRRIDAMFAEQRFVDQSGPIAANAPFRPGSFVWFHRDLPDEVHVPFDVDVVHRDDTVVVAHKPHFLSTIPRGKHVLQSALLRLRAKLDLPDLSPAHRLDRVTAGLILFVVNPEHRGAYQTMFAKRAVHKEYEAIAPVRPDLDLPRTVRSRIIKERGIIAAQEEPGPANAETRVELLATRGGLGRYRLLPVTGRTHQLRVHMSSLGIPILGDRVYPELVETALDDFTRPLQLLARTLAFTDPISGQARCFTSNATLQAWSSHPEWAGPEVLA